MNDFGLRFCHRAGKQIYDTRKDIADALHAMKKRNPDSPRLETYQCGFCKGWHYTSAGVKFKGKPASHWRGSKKPL